MKIGSGLAIDALLVSGTFLDKRGTLMHSRKLGLLAFLAVGGWALAQTPATVNPPLPPTAVAPSGVPTVPGGGPNYPAVPAFGSVPTGPAVLPSGTALAYDSGPSLYGSAEYLLWFVQNGSIPSTATTLPVGVVAITFADTYFDPFGNFLFEVPINGYVDSEISSTVSFGFGNETKTGAQSGSRVYLGFWADDEKSFGVETNFLFLSQSSDRFSGRSATTNGQFIINTGFEAGVFEVDSEGNKEQIGSSSVLTIRQVESGLVGYAATALWGGEINARSVFCRIGGMDVGTLAGFRYLGFKDELGIFNTVNLTRPQGIQRARFEDSVSLSENLTLQTRDRTRIWNHFFGGHAGIDFDWENEGFYFYTRLKIGIGNMVQIADVNSFTTLTNNDAVRVDPLTGNVRQTSPQSIPLSSGGLLAAPGENGRHTRQSFSYIPEINLKFGYRFTDWMRGFAGYDFLWIHNVARAGISTTPTTINTTAQAGSDTMENIAVAAPSFRFQNTDIWVQGINFGLELSY